MSTAFDKIASGLADAIAYADGDKTKGRVAAGPDVKAIRGQDKAEPGEVCGEAAGAGGDGARLGAAPRLPDAPARTLLGMVDADPVVALGLIEQSQS